MVQQQRSEKSTPPSKQQEPPNPPEEMVETPPTNADVKDAVIINMDHVTTYIQGHTSDEPFYRPHHQTLQ